MQCPICDPLSLQQVTLEEHLVAHQCLKCAGIFISSTNYWAWLEKHDASQAQQNDMRPIDIDAEVPRPKQCPACRHLIFPYKIASDIAFTIDHCKNCNSFWLSQEKWLALRRRNFHDDLHHIVAEPWQRHLREEEHQIKMQALYTEKFGAEDYAEIRRVKTWLDSHPRRSMLYAYLNAEDPYK